MYIEHPQIHPSSERRTTSREVFLMSKLRPQTYTLEKYTHAHNLKPIEITGLSVTNFRERRNVPFRANVTLKGVEGVVFLQRFGPPDQDTFKAMQKTVTDGYDRLTDLLSNAKFHQSEKKRVKKTTNTGEPLEVEVEGVGVVPQIHREDPKISPEERKRFHLGAWHDQASKRLALTTDTLQDSLKVNAAQEAKKAVGSFCAWLHKYTNDFVEPLINGDSGLCEQFQDILTKRNADFKWVNDRVPGLEKYCNSMYSTFTPFKGFSEGLHSDKNDSGISILINFGQHAMLALPEYNCEVELQPYDITFFRSCSVLHNTSPLACYATKEDPSKRLERWAVSCYFRRWLDSHLEPVYDNVHRYVNEAHSQLAAAAEEESHRRSRKRKR